VVARCHPTAGRRPYGPRRACHSLWVRQIPIIAAALSLVTVVALTPLFTDLPEAVLAALIIHAVSHLMKVGEMRRFRRLCRASSGWPC
jgi:hypothetical protein